ncbi:MAG: Holliday junction branch migration protein RuvA [Streptococcaceae bacterium]|jgi:Holliday junction DNA helicase RuvA|nr:Holliday junction branch migration protein RuvA [Streptococcaceae bacterium]
MFEYIIGKISLISPSYIVIERDGLGYKLYVANPYRFSGYVDQERKVFLHQVVREDAQMLYGFMDESEKAIFERLINVSGIGPKSALAILAPEDHLGLLTAIQNADITYLTKFPGVGKKTAQQMVLDLQDKLAKEFSNSGVPQPEIESGELEDALQALKTLGYAEKDLKKLKKELTGESLTTDGYIRKALKLLTSKR